MPGRKHLACAVVGVIGAAMLSGAPLAQADGPRTYEVTITNLTRGQPFTPPLLATHRGDDAVFEVGDEASAGVRQIAENGDNGPLAAALAADRHVSGTTAVMTPIVPAGRVMATGLPSQVTATVTADRGARRLSFAMMLICTNDGFTGVNGLKLPKHAGRSVTAMTAAYDAGTEINTQMFGDMVPPCRPLITGGPMMGTGTTNPALAEGGNIRHHPGIQAGVGALDPAVFGWVDPVARVRVTRIG